MDVQEIFKLEEMLNGILVGEFLGLFIAWCASEKKLYIYILSMQNDNPSRGNR